MTLSANTKLQIRKGEAQQRQHDLLRRKIVGLIKNCTDSERKERMHDRIARIEVNVTALDERLCALKDGTAETLKSKAIPYLWLLTAREFTPRRVLTLQETRVGFVALNEQFNQQEDDLAKKLKDLTHKAIIAMILAIQNKLKANNIPGLADTSLGIRTEVRRILNDAIRNAHETGKTGAFREINAALREAKKGKNADKVKDVTVTRPATPQDKSSLMGMEADDIAENYNTNVEDTVRNIVKVGIGAGAVAAAIIVAAKAAAEKAAERNIQNIAGTVIGQYINQGRKLVFDENVLQITAYQRSEVLDDVTCPVCEDLDETIITADDPFSNLDLVHSNCRGVWVPIYGYDENQPKKEDIGVAPSLADRFETIDGRPVTNAFKQMKRPIKQP